MHKKDNKNKRKTGRYLQKHWAVIQCKKTYSLGTRVDLKMLIQTKSTSSLLVNVF